MELFTTRGYLDRGHVGGIAYTYNVPEEFDRLEIDFSFNKREVEELTAGIREETRMAFVENFGDLTTDEMVEASVAKMKAEMNVSLFINDDFIGSAHRDETHKQIVITKEEASLGFVPFNSVKGVIKIVLNVISVVNDETEYKLMVKVGEGK